MIVKNEPLGEPINAVIFGGSNVTKSLILTKAALELARSVEQFNVVRICETSRTGMHSPARRALRRAMQRLVKVSDDGPLVDRPLMTLKGLARRYRVEFCTPPNRNANHPSVYSDLPRTKGINLALCVGCAQLFGPQLLDAFDACVNLHDGALPAYRGRLVTQWSVYHGETQSGFTYHYMVKEVDAGRVLLQDSVPIGNKSIGRLQLEKSHRSSLQLPRVIAAIGRRDLGVPQEGAVKIYTKSDAREMICIEELSGFPFDEVRRRLRAFGRIQVKVQGQYYNVVSLRTDRQQASGSRVLTTRDGVMVGLSARLGQAVLTRLS